MWRSVSKGTVVLALAAVFAGQSHAQLAELRVETRDGERRALVLPARRRPAPTVLVLHGAFNSAPGTARRFGFAEAAAVRGFTAVYPEGVKRQWNDGREDHSWGPDDVGFLRQVVGKLVGMRVADPDRVYIVGISNGGMMALRMLCEASELFAGAGTVIANMPTRIGPTCRPQRAVPIVMLNGTADPLIPYAGGGVGPLSLGGFVWGSERTAAHVARANGCGPARNYTDVSTEEMSITRIAWSGCKPDATVTLYRVNGGRHEVFGRPPVLPAMLHTRRHEISAAETIMAAFENRVRGSALIDAPDH
jgi:polyhydroxybutyrate depolymerase